MATLTRKPLPPAIRPSSDWTTATSTVEINRWRANVSTNSHKSMPGIKHPLSIVMEVAAYANLVQKTFEPDFLFLCPHICALANFPPASAAVPLPQADDKKERAWIYGTLELILLAWWSNYRKALSDPAGPPPSRAFAFSLLSKH